MTLLQQLKNFIHNLFIRKGKSGREIPDCFFDDESLVRGVFTPIYYSSRKNKLREGAFLPPPKKKDVSILRLNFSNDNSCKNHCSKIKIGDSKYCGLSIFLANHITIVATKYNIENLVYLRFSPLIEDFKTLNDVRPIYTTSIGLPMHADIYYDGDFEPEKPQTKFRQFAKCLAEEISTYFEDKYPTTENWNNDKLEWRTKS